MDWRVDTFLKWLFSWVVHPPSTKCHGSSFIGFYTILQTNSKLKQNLLRGCNDVDLSRGLWIQSKASGLNVLKKSQYVPLNPLLRIHPGTCERGGCLSFKLKPSTRILAANQKEILGPCCCQFQFIRGKCHLLILITAHNSLEVSMWTATVSERVKSYNQTGTASRDLRLPWHSNAPESSLSQNATHTQREWERNRPWRNLFERETH